MTDPSTTVPSDEAVAAAARVLLPHAGVPECERDAWRAEAVEDARATLTAAYAIDAPRLRAEAAAEARAGVLQELDTIERYGAKLTLLVKQRDDALARAAEARAATLREVEAWFRDKARGNPRYTPWDHVRESFAAHFNPEASE